MKNRAHHFRRDRASTASIEFAIIALVMVVLFLGTIELVNAIRIQGKLNIAAGQLAEMIASQSVVTEGAADRTGGTLADMCTAASYNLYPYNPASLSAWMESTTVDAGRNLPQDWLNDSSCPSKVTAGEFTESVTLTLLATGPPDSMFTIDGSPTVFGGGGNNVPGYTTIIVRLSYVYTNVLPFFLGPSITLIGVGITRPRADVASKCYIPSGVTTTSCPNLY